MLYASKYQLGERLYRRRGAKWTLDETRTTSVLFILKYWEIKFKSVRSQLNWNRKYNNSSIRHWDLSAWITWLAIEMWFYDTFKKDYHYCECPKYLRLRQQFEKVFPRVNASSSMKYKFSNMSQSEDHKFYSVDNKNKASAQHMLLFLSSPEKQSCERGIKHHQPGVDYTLVAKVR